MSGTLSGSKIAAGVGRVIHGQLIFGKQARVHQRTPTSQFLLRRFRAMLSPFSHRSWIRVVRAFLLRLLLDKCQKPGMREARFIGKLWIFLLLVLDMSVS
jgi:hypothetical protein